ncbi:MAG: adenosylcobinamide-GDP ribazoletransferase [Salaquimonas sp.]
MMLKLIDQTLFALRFFTRLKIPGKQGHEGDLAAASITFPLVGLIIGLLIASVWAISVSLLPALPAAGIAIGFGILITGALHEDGISDCADGMGGGHTKERALEIMRDSRIGAYGAIAIVLTIGIRWASLSELNLIGGIFALIIAHMASRSAIVIALAGADYARDAGLGSSVSSGVETQILLIISAICVAISFLLGGVAGLVALVFAFTLSWLFLQYLKKRLGGYTGDGLGAMEQIAQITILVTLSGFWG